MGNVFTGLMQSVGASRKVFEYMERIPEITNQGQTKPPNLEGKIVFDNVRFAYPSRKDVEVLDVCVNFQLIYV